MVVLSCLVSLCYLLSVVVGQSACPSLASSCGDCISYKHEKCVWCPEDIMTNIETSRCQSEQLRSNTAWCRAQVKPSLTEVKFGSKLPISVTSKGDKVHFSPQDVAVKIRPSSPEGFNLTYKIGRAYPLDVYMLLDYSYSMGRNEYYDGKSALNILRERLQNIEEELVNITDNVYIGLGVFMEKPVLPHSQSDQLSFKHLYNLGPRNHFGLITEYLSKDGLGGNNDDPEAGLDALLQVMVCQQEVGWREKARRIIVLCTDSTYHSAGDGRVLGIITPCDENCRLSNNTYEENSKLYDYPSIGLINKVARDKNIQIIFVAPEELRQDYEGMSGQIQGSVYVPLTGTFLSSISYEYEKSILHPQLIIPKSQSNIKVTVEPACDIPSTKECEVGLDQDKTVQVRIELISCPDGEKKVEIGLLGIEQKLEITLQPICECKCGKNTDKSTECSNNGYLECGVCKCNTGWSGNDCDCSTKVTKYKLIEKCRYKNDSQTCSGKGDCRCGKCFCTSGFSGNFCEFDDDACLKPNGKLCADHGNCSWGTCKCEAGWTGTDCNCPLSNVTCIASYTRKECFGNGYCRCGKCVCNRPPQNSSVSFYQPYCQSSEPRCKEFDDLVNCRFYNNSAKCLSADDLVAVPISSVNKTEFDELYELGYSLCIMLNEDGSKLKYKYKDLRNRNSVMHIVIQNELEYPGLPVRIWAAIAATIGIVLLVGLLTLVVWKILIDRRDAYEYAQYEKELKMQRLMEENQLYVSPESYFSNPTYSLSDYS